MIHAPRQCMDCPIIIFDEQKNLITETIVTGYGKDEMYIEVSEGLENISIGSRLWLLVIHADSVSEFSGKLTSLRQGIYEISVHGQRKRDSRGSPRFSIDIPAVINNLIIDSEVVNLTNPINVTIKNISSTGLMIESKSLPLHKGVSLNIEFKLHDKNTITLCKVVREPKTGSTPNHFGCQLIFPE